MTDYLALAEEGQRWRFTRFAPTGDTADLIDALAAAVRALVAENTWLTGEVEVAERRGAERAYRDVAARPYDVPRWEVSGDLVPHNEVLRGLWDAWVTGRLAALFPAPATDTQGVGE